LLIKLNNPLHHFLASRVCNLQPVLGKAISQEVKEPFGENVLSITDDAIRRLLRPDARLIPSHVAVYGIPVTIAADELAKKRVANDSLANWKTWYGFDFQALQEMEFHDDRILTMIRPFKAANWPRLTEPIKFIEVDLRCPTPPIDVEIDTNAVSAGEANGLLMYFELQLSPGVRYSTHPDHAPESTHWLNPVWGAYPLFSLEIRDKIRVAYRRDSGSTSVNLDRFEDT